MNCINHSVRFSGVHGEHMGDFNAEDLFEDSAAAELCRRLLGMTCLDFLLIKFKGREKQGVYRRLKMNSNSFQRQAVILLH